MTKTPHWDPKTASGLNALRSFAPGHPGSLTTPPTAVTVQHTVTLSPPRGALCVLPESVSLVLLPSIGLTRG